MFVPIGCIYLLIFLLLFALTAFFLLRSVHKKTILRRQKEKQELEKEILATEIRTSEKVHNEIAAELHDNINQMLTAVRLMLNMTLHNGNIDEKNTEYIKYCEKTVATAIEEIRILTRRSSYHIQHYSLDQAITSLINELKLINSISFMLTITGKEIDLPNDAKVSIYRIVQESLNNIIKHSAAKNAVISLNYNDPHLTMSIQDDGMGFDISSVNSSKSYGIKNIKNRAAVLNATIDWESRVNEGTTIKLTI
jgi:signal transduction histidine kinase